MIRKPALNDCKKTEIKTLIIHNELTDKEIARITCVSLSTINRMRRKLKKGFDIYSNDRRNCGRKAITSTRDIRIIEKIIKNNRNNTLKQLHLKVKQSGIDISVRTLQRRIYSLGYKGRRPMKKPKLTPLMMKKRLAWAKKYEYFTKEDWEKVSIKKS